MRHHGIASTGGGLGLGDHLCWPFDGYEDFRAEALAFLADGLALGQRVLYTAERPLDELLGDVRAGLPDAEQLLESGAVVVESLLDTYETSSVADPGAQAAAYVGLTEAAVADGYTGLRVAADATLLIAEDTTREAFLRYEHLIDRAMLETPFTAMCGYDRTRLPMGAADELASIHPHRRIGSSSFALFNGPDGLVVTGDVDAAIDPLFDAALRAVLTATTGEGVTIDCSDLDYLDSRGFAALDRAAEAARVVVHLDQPPPSSLRLVELLDPVSIAVRSRR